MLLGFLVQFLGGILSLAGLVVGGFWFFKYHAEILQGYFGGYVTMFGTTFPGWWSIPAFVLGSYFNYLNTHTLRARIRVD